MKEKACFIHDVSKSVCECDNPKFSQYVDFCLNCGLPPKDNEQTGC